MSRLSILGVAAAALLVTSSTASAALVTFNTRAGFDAQAGVLPIETFEEGNIGPGGITACPSPLNSATNNGCFSPGDILPGLELRSDGTDPATGLALAGAGFVPGLASKAVFANWFVEPLDVLLGASNAVGFDLVSVGDSTIRVSVFGAGDALLGTFDVAATAGSSVFFGVINDAGLITRLQLGSLTNQAEAIDNVAFGQTAIPEPATLTLLGAGLLGAVRARRRARS